MQWVGGDAAEFVMVERGEGGVRGAAGSAAGAANQLRRLIPWAGWYCLKESGA